MTTTTFDTLAYSKKLKAAGMPEQQADIQAEALFELVDEKLATKKDLELLKKDLIIKLGGMIIFSSLSTISILGFLMKFGH